MGQLKLDCQKRHEPSDQSNLHNTQCHFAPQRWLYLTSAQNIIVTLFPRHNCSDLSMRKFDGAM